MFTALPMFLAECYGVSEILLLLKGAKQCPRLKAFNKASAYASAVVILVLAVIAGDFYKDFHPRMVGFRVVPGGQ